MKRRVFSSLLFALCVVVLFSINLTVHAQSQVTLIGTVTGLGGSPKGGARVEFSPEGYVTVTDQNGKFAIKQFHPGKYTVTVWEGNKYQKFRQDVQEDTIELRVNW